MNKALLLDWINERISRLHVLQHEVKDFHEMAASFSGAITELRNLRELIASRRFDEYQEGSYD